MPLLFIPSLRQLSHLSWLGFVSTLVVMFAVCAATADDPHRTAAPIQVRRRPSHISIEALGIAPILPLGICVLVVSIYVGEDALMLSVPLRHRLTCHVACAAQPAPGHEAVHWGIIQAFGIFAVSVSGHSSLPSVRSSMAQPHLFGRVLNLAFLAMVRRARACICVPPSWFDVHPPH